MSKFKLKVSGVEETIASFSRFDKATRVAVRNVVQKSATRIRKAARMRVPFKSGIMQKSIRARFSKDKFSAEVAPRSPFAHLVEFGTVHSRAEPFMTPTAEEELPKYKADMETALKQAVKKA